MTKTKYSVGYFSAYYRGLECLLDVWLEIREQVPKAKLDIYYGWQSWLAFEGKNNLYYRITAKLEALKEHGVTEHGRVSHKELAKAMDKTEVWAYPTEFAEIHCITALKANAAGMKPVITDVAALKETGGPNATFIETARIYSDDYAKRKFVEAVVHALKNPQTKEEQQKQKDWVKQFTWSEVAKSWEEAING